MKKILFILFCGIAHLALCQSDYEQEIAGTPVKIKMAAIPGGNFLMGSATKDKNRQTDEGPQVQVTIAPFWMSATEITHDAFAPFRFEDKDAPPKPDAISRPTAQYIDLTWGMGKEGGFPVNSMQPFTALQYCRWLWKKTGVFYRLPTEAEWEYACLGKEQAAKNLSQQAWFAGNAKEAYHQVGQKQPNAYGLFDMLGNVSEWTMDAYSETYFEQLARQPEGSFFVKPATFKAYRTARGGGFRAKKEDLRCANRFAQTEDWNQRDPQRPRSKWWLTDGDDVGFRIVKPATQPTKDEAEAFFKALLEVK